MKQRSYLFQINAAVRLKSHIEVQLQVDLCFFMFSFAMKSFDFFIYDDLSYSLTLNRCEFCLFVITLVFVIVKISSAQIAFLFLIHC